MRVKCNDPDLMADAIRAQGRKENAKIDEEEGRIRIPGWVLGTLQNVIGAHALLYGSNPVLKRTARQFGCWKWLRLAEVSLKKALECIDSKLCVTQIMTYRANGEHQKISISSKPAEQCINIPVTEWEVVVRAALKHCTHHCIHSEKEAQKCKLRRVLEDTPGIEMENDAKWLACPFMTIEGIEEDE